MAYGDSANWDGNVPTALSSYTLEWQVEWRGQTGPPKPFTCKIQFFGGEDARTVASALARAWDDENPHGRQAAFDGAVNAYQVRFDGPPHDMAFKCYKDGDPVPSNYTKVLYGQRTPIYPGWGLSVFKS
jgi:hypothetical protein